MDRSSLLVFMKGRGCIVQPLILKHLGSLFFDNVSDVVRV